MAILKANRTMEAKNPLGAIGITMGLCLALFGAATIFALNQPPRPDPFAPPSLYDKILSPWEENAFLRLPMVTGTLNDVAVVKGSGHIWTVGNDGLILASRDRGTSFQRVDLPGSRAAPKAPPKAPLGLKNISKAAGFNWSPGQWGTSRAWAASQKDYSKKAVPDLRQQSSPQQQSRPVQKPTKPPPPSPPPTETDEIPLPPLIPRPPSPS